MSNEHVHSAFHGALPGSCHECGSPFGHNHYCPTLKPAAKPAKRHQLPKGECAYCDRDREREQGNTFHPSHDASERCESGKRPHCSCDTCF